MPQILGIGTDIAECPRIADLIERHGDHFVKRVFTPREIEYCQKHRAFSQHFAGRWAAKEAVLKAIGTGWIQGILWTDIEIRLQPGGRPVIALAGGARDICEEKGIGEILISISHCREYATAYALAVGRETPKP